MDIDWDERFTTQSKWTDQLRQFLYQQIGINNQSKILEVGCGTGVITSELLQYTSIPPTGIDIQFSRIKKALEVDQKSKYFCADGFSLPFNNNCFDYILTHYFFLWIQDPVTIATEMLRVLKRGGILVALAEPDYQARIDAPYEFERLGQIQTQSLISQGANPKAGRSLPEIFSKSGLSEIQFGLSGFQIAPNHLPNWFESEWKVINRDLSGQFTKIEMDHYQQLDQEAREAGVRVFWVPTFYSYGKKL
ncbi:MAG: class I SAM-dependent methyltransferase [Chloroflexi bacterium]|nr:class I SAM-dependent methyltransferase [Chloroflexota bacterium]